MPTGDDDILRGYIFTSLFLILSNYLEIPRISRCDNVSVCQVSPGPRVVSFLQFGTECLEMIRPRDLFSRHCLILLIPTLNIQ